MEECFQVHGKITKSMAKESIQMKKNKKLSNIGKMGKW